MSLLAKNVILFYNKHMDYQKIYDGLIDMFGDAECELEYSDPYTLLVAVILSAQCTDKRVNKVTPALFQKYPTVYDMAKADNIEVESIIRSCGFYHNKAKNIINASKDIVSKYNGKVPNTLEELISLAGVGRKTANVVLGTIFHKPAIAVDTHVFRVSNRLGLSQSTTPNKCEQDLMKVIPIEKWSNSHLLLVLLGRYICKARTPLCEECKLKQYCEEYNARDKR